MLFGNIFLRYVQVHYYTLVSCGGVLASGLYGKVTETFIHSFIHSFIIIISIIIIVDYD